MSEAGSKESGLEARGATEFIDDLRAYSLRKPLLAARRVHRQGFGGKGCRLYGEEDALTRDRIDQARRVADRQPAWAGEHQVVEVSHRQGWNRPRIRLEPTAGPNPRRLYPPSDSIPKRAGANAGVRLRANPDGEVVMARKGPDVPGRIVHDLDDDFIARPVTDEVSASDRQLIAAEGRGESPPDQSVRAVRADHERGLERPSSCGLDPEPARLPRDARDALGKSLGARLLGRRIQQ